MRLTRNVLSVMTVLSLVTCHSNIQRFWCIVNVHNTVGDAKKK